MQAGRKLIEAISHDREDDTQAVWQDESLNPLDRAKALYFALFYQRDQISLWLLAQPDMPAVAGVSILDQAPGRSYQPHWDMIWRTRSHSLREALTRAAIDARIPCPGAFKRDSSMLRCLLMEGGGQGLLLHAVEAGFWMQSDDLVRLAQSRPAGCDEQQNRREVSNSPSAARAIKELKLPHAVLTKDLQCLRHGARWAVEHSSHQASLAYLGVLHLAARAGWVEGVELLVRGPWFSVNGSRFLLEGAMEAVSLECLDLLLSCGPVWHKGAVGIAQRRASFKALQDVAEQGVGRCSRHLGTLITRLPPLRVVFGLDFPSGSCLASPPREPGQSSQPGGQFATGVADYLGPIEPSPADRRLTACVLALVHARGAGLLASEMRCWREPVVLLLRWWARESLAYSRRRREGGASTHLPHVLATIIHQSDIFAPQDLQRAAVVAAKICEREQIACPV